MRIMIGLSGGVDSSVAAARLVEAGHEVTGVNYAFGAAGVDGDPDARRIAGELGIDFEVWDFRKEFAEVIMGYFTDEYAAGRTPNPCVRCNSTMKFGRVLDRALASGFDAVATGHYARTELQPDGSVALLRAADSAKDQSYVLAVLRPDQLERVHFPLGDSRKPEVRAEAAARGLPTASKPDSLDICFIPDGDTAGFLGRKLGIKAGEVVDADGAAVGTHAGAHGFTVGQRKGLKLGRPAADGRPRYVIGTNAATNTVTVGPREALRVTGLRCAPTSWTRVVHDEPVACRVQVRAHGAPLSAIVTSGPDGTEVRFDEPTYGIAPGQYAVFYSGDEAIGMATIEGTLT